ncbi:hypothetical protein SAMN05216359_102248 [Roseateles sp. YR242]|uniref:lipopolysaccharide biosynthesis protein n=1 Tax=Roseateles sp. YR242 TaxID=1855305 RepID=UPI0008D10E1E|nr:hypothetical protein [Roseateles sp. YR242]SEK57306.1 hypothetical protein SAMN05216359_102248 [Roseateles sp. YR242]
MTAVPQERLLTRLSRLGGLDAHVLSTLLFRGWALLAGVLTMLLVPLCLPKEHQGFYFTFSSLISIQIFFELGFNHVISQLVSHEAALMHASTDPAQRQWHASRLASVRHLGHRWYQVMAILFALVVFVAGLVFFEAQKALPAGEWWMPWALICGASALNLYASPQLAISEGLGRVDRVARLRLVQSMVGYGAMWVLLLLHARLWSAVLVPAAGAALSLWWIRHRAHLHHPRGPTADLPSDPSATISWRRDVFPLQWRIALSWISGYFIFQIFNPFVFAFHGAAEAGRTGLALAAYTAILGLGMSWVNASTPMMSAAIACGDRDKLRSIFRRVAVRSMAFTVMATLILVSGRAAAAYAGLPLAERIADVPILLLMGGATVGNCLIGAMAIFMRCHKEEPMLQSAVVVAVLTLAGVASTSRYDVHWPFAMYAGITVLVGLPWTVLIFRRYWRR